MHRPGKAEVELQLTFGIPGHCAALARSLPEHSLPSELITQSLLQRELSA